MIKKFAHLTAPPDRVREVFCDVEAWPEWMPGVRSVRVLDRRDGTVRARLDQTLRGRKARQVMEFRQLGDGLRQLQVEGFFKRWQADWQFLEHPSGRGTTLSLLLDYDLGLLGLVTPQRAVQSMFDGLFRDVVKGLRDRLGQVPAGGPEQGAPGEVLMEVYETSAGLEIVVGGRRYVLPPAD